MLDIGRRISSVWKGRAGANEGTGGGQWDWKETVTTGSSPGEDMGGATGGEAMV